MITVAPLPSPKVDIEVDAVIEGSLAAESSLVVLDTVELLILTMSTVENLRSLLGRVSEWEKGEGGMFGWVGSLIPRQSKRMLLPHF